MVSTRLNCLLTTWSMLLWRQRKISTGYTSTFRVLGRSTTLKTKMVPLLVTLLIVYRPLSPEVSLASAPCAPEVVGRPKVHTRTAACARRQLAPAKSPHSPPAAPSGGTTADLKSKPQNRFSSMMLKIERAGGKEMSFDGRGNKGKVDGEQVTKKNLMDLSYPQTMQCCRSDPGKTKSFDLQFPQTPSTAHTIDIPSDT